MSLSLQYDIVIQVLFQRAYKTISINPHYLTIGKMLSLTLTIHSYIICLFFAIAYIYDGVLYDCTRRFHRVVYPQTTREIRVTK